MTYVITCAKCGSKKPLQLFEKKSSEPKKGLAFKYIQNHGIFYCPHVKVFERITISRWKKNQ